MLPNKRYKVIIKVIKSVLLTVCILFIAGFDFSNHSIPLKEIYSGGPPKDGIPALTDPELITKEKAVDLDPDDRVLGFIMGGEARAYPLRILNWHEVVNDMVGGEPVVITYCPLTGSGIAFRSTINGKRIIFGVSGKLYNSNLLLYDRVTESLWSQLKMEAVTGEMTGTKLQQLPLLNTTWDNWKNRYPDTKVLSFKTRHIKDYSRDPYDSYHKSNRIYFPISRKSSKLAQKELVLGLIINGKIRTYPVRIISKMISPVNDVIGSRKVVIYFDEKTKTAWAEYKDGDIIPSVMAYWFAWYTFYPEGDIYMFKK